MACIKHSSGEHNTNSEKLKEIQSVIFRHFVLAAPEQEDYIPESFQEEDYIPESLQEEDYIPESLQEEDYIPESLQNKLLKLMCHIASIQLHDTALPKYCDLLD